MFELNIQALPKFVTKESDQDEDDQKHDPDCRPVRGNSGQVKSTAMLLVYSTMKHLDKHVEHAMD